MRLPECSICSAVKDAVADAAIAEVTAVEVAADIITTTTADADTATD